MSAATNLFRRGAVYYFRRRVRWSDGATSAISISLRTRRLAPARVRAALLAAACEQLHGRLDMSGDHSLTHAQRRRIFQTQLTCERDRLDALHCAVLNLPNDDVAPQRHSDEFPAQLARMAQICREWIGQGCPTTDHFRDLESYLDHVFGAELDELDRIDILGGLGSLEALAHALGAAASHALRAVGAESSADNAKSALKVIFSAKLVAIAAFREGLLHPAAAYRNSACASPTRTQGDFPQPEWPFSHLLDIDPGCPDDTATTASPRRRDRGARSVAASAAPAWSAVTIVEAAERYLQSVHASGRPAAAGNKRDAWDNKTVRQFRTTAMLADKAISQPLVTVTHDDIARLNALFDRLPASHHKSPRHARMSLEAICTEGAARVARGELAAQGIGLSGVATNRHFYFLQLLFDWVRREVPSMPVIYWKDFYVADRRDPRSVRDAYDVDQGRALFTLPIWTGCANYQRRFEPGPEIFHDSGYFVPLLIWYGGLRRSEACCRLVDDVQYIKGVHGLLIRSNELGRVKNATSERFVPFAPELIRLGFLDYVRLLRERGEKRLFPDLAAPGTAAGDCFYHQFGKGLHQALPFLSAGMFLHSMRHTVETELAEAGIDVKLRNDLLGHANPSEGDGRYAKRASPAALEGVVRAVPVVTDHLDGSPIRLAPTRIYARRSRAAKARRRSKPRPRLVWDADRDSPNH